MVIMTGGVCVCVCVCVLAERKRGARSRCAPFFDSAQFSLWGVRVGRDRVVVARSRTRMEGKEVVVEPHASGKGEGGTVRKHTKKQRAGAKGKEGEKEGGEERERARHARREGRDVAT